MQPEDQHVLGDLFIFCRVELRVCAPLIIHRKDRIRGKHRLKARDPFIKRGMSCKHARERIPAGEADAGVSAALHDLVSDVLLAVILLSEMAALRKVSRREQRLV